MSQHDQKTINPLMAAVIGVAVGAAATYLMRKEKREELAKNISGVRKKTQALVKDAQKKIDQTRTDLKTWAEDMGEKAEETASKIERQARSRKVAAA